MNITLRSICILSFLIPCSTLGMIEGVPTLATQAGLLPTMQQAPQMKDMPSFSSFDTLKYRLWIGSIVLATACAVGGCWYGWRCYKISCHEAEMARRRTEEEQQNTFAQSIASAIEFGSLPAMEGIAQVIAVSALNLPQTLEAHIVRSAIARGRIPIGRSLFQRYPQLRKIGLQAQADLIAQRDHLNALITAAEAMLNNEKPA